MFESALVEHKLGKEEYELAEPELRTRLIEAQLALLERRPFAMIVLVSGMDGAGKTEVMHRLSEWLDPRHLQTVAYGDRDEAERARPAMWRYWRDLPARGEIAVMFGSWYSEPLRDRLLGQTGRNRFERQLAAINRFEEMLSDEGIVLLKFLLVLSAAEQKRRLKALAKRTGGASRVFEEWTDVAHRDQAGAVVGEAVRRTSSNHAPWTVLPCDDPEYRDLSLGRAVLACLQSHLEAVAVVRPLAVPVAIPNVDRRNVLDTLDLALALDKAESRKRLERAQFNLLEQSQRKAFRDRALVVVFEGHDAAGKGGAIRRVVVALDPRQYRIYPIAAPNEEEKVHPYLWRFWRNVPPRGRIAIFDRSWYGRVLVERVEGFASPTEWGRAYSEINDFEEELAEGGIILVKLWLAIGKDEQLRRFEERADTGYKQFKITDEDWRNREKWDLYHDAIGDMIDRTSTTMSPWTLVEAQDKRWARVKVVETLVDRLTSEL
jgi:polyphosphate:AMP phosphotransferase